MKNDTSFSSSLFLHTDSFDTNKNNNIETNLEQNNNLSKDTKINNISINDSIKNNGNSSPNLQYPFFNSNKNQESKDQSELNNFDIAFFLPKDLKENIEADEEEFQNENEHNFNDDEFNSKQINNFNADSFNQFNYFNNEYSNLTTDKFNFKNFNNFQISGNECFNNINDNKNQENINYGINLNSFDSFYKNINLNQNISSKNFSNNNMNDFFVKQENEQKINMPYNMQEWIIIKSISISYS